MKMVLLFIAVSVFSFSSFSQDEEIQNKSNSKEAVEVQTVFKSALPVGGFIGVGQTTYPISGGGNIFVFKSAPSGTLPNTAEYYTIDTLVGLEGNLNGSNFRMYPNPCVNTIYLDFDGAEDQLIEVYNTLGVLVSSKVLKSGLPYDVSFLQPGCYYGKCKQEVFKFIKL